MEKNDNNQNVLKVYEIGYLLVPTVAEENVAGEVQTIKNLIDSKGASVITEDFPKLRPLAYTMAKAIGSQRSKYDKGYFGWIKFEVDPKVISEIKRELDKNTNILRMMIIETVRENTLIGQKMIFSPGAAGDKEKGPDAPKISEEELDKTIETLVVE